MAFNNFGYMNPTQPKTPQQLQIELSNMLQGQYAPVYNAYQQQQMQSPIMNKPSTSGIYDKISSYQDVENYPTPTDGTAVLLFNYESGVFYSKKFVNGQSTIQTFTFMPLNSNSVEDVKIEPKQSDSDKNTPDYINTLLDRIEALERKISKPRAIKKTESEAKDEL